MAPKTILIAEDEHVVQLLCRRLLDPRAYRLLQAESVQEAIGILEKEVPDLLITDLRFPDGDGVDVVRFLWQKHDAVKVLVITGSLTPEERLDQIVRLGQADFLPKPFDVDEFKRLIDAALGPEKKPPVSN